MDTQRVSMTAEDLRDLLNTTDVLRWDITLGICDMYYNDRKKAIFHKWVDVPAGPKTTRIYLIPVIEETWQFVPEIVRFQYNHHKEAWVTMNVDIVIN